MEVMPWSAKDATAGIGALTGLLRDSIEAGATIGFVLPVAEAEIEAYWRKVVRQIAAGRLLLWVARAEGELVGSAQLALEAQPHNRHRAEVRKVLVHSAQHRRGIGRMLMLALEAEAMRRGLLLLTLDTKHGSPAERLYAGLGYSCAGAIPAYARMPDSGLQAKAIYFKELPGG